jgi:hypothetical protein
LLGYLKGGRGEYIYTRAGTKCFLLWFILRFKDFFIWLDQKKTPDEIGPVPLDSSILGYFF